MTFHNQTIYKGHTIANVLDKPILHKKGKQWVVVSLSALMLLGLGGAAKVSATHADTVAQPSASATRMTSSSMGDIQQKATNMHGELLSSSAAKMPNSNISNNSSNQGMNTLSLGTKDQQNRVWNYVQNGIQYHGYTHQASNVHGQLGTKDNVHQLGQDNDVANQPTQKAKAVGNLQSTQPSDKISERNWIYQNGKYLSSDAAHFTQTGQHNGLDYKYDPNLKALEITGGSIHATGGMDDNNSLIPFVMDPMYSSPQSDAFAGANSIKLDGTIDTEQMYQPVTISLDNNIKAITFSDTFNTSHVTNINSMIGLDRNLQAVELGKHFDTSHATELSGLFNGIGLSDLDLGPSFSTAGVLLAHQSEPLFEPTYNSYNHQEMYIKTLHVWPKTRFHTADEINQTYKNQQGKTVVLPWYLKDMNDNYTSAQPINPLDKQAYDNMVKPYAQMNKPMTWTTTCNPRPEYGYTAIQYQCNGKDLGNPVQLKSGKSDFGNSVSVNSLDNVPVGYQLVDPNVQVTYNHASAKDANDNPEYITVIRKKENVLDNVAFILSDGTSVKNSLSQYYGQVGDTEQVKASDIPAGYELANSNGTFTLGKYPAGSSQAVYHTHVFVVKKAGNDDIPAVHNAVDINGTVTLHFSDNGKSKDIPLYYMLQDNDGSKPVDILDHVNYADPDGVTTPNYFLGKDIQGLNTSSFVYTGQQNAGQYQPKQSDFNYDHGSINLLTHNITLNYQAKPNTDPLNSEVTDNIEYINSDNNVVGQQYVSGEAGRQFNLVNSLNPAKSDVKPNVPGYTINSSNPNESDRLTYDGLTHNIRVAGNPLSPKAKFSVVINEYATQSDTSLGNSFNTETKPVALNSTTMGQSFMVNPADYAPTGFKLTPSDAAATVQVEPSKNGQSYQFNIMQNGRNKFNADKINFDYIFDPKQAENTVTFNYKDINHDGKVVKVQKVTDAPSHHVADMPDTSNTYLSTASYVPDGYELAENARKIKPTLKSQTINVKVIGKQAKDLDNTNRGIVNLHIVKQNYDPRTHEGKVLSNYDTPVNLGDYRVGDTFVITPVFKNLTPVGYTPDSSNTNIEGKITPDGGAVISNGTSTFIYDVLAKDNTDIDYVDANNPANQTVTKVNALPGKDIINNNIPYGYHLPVGSNYHFNDNGQILDATNNIVPNNKVTVYGDHIHGTANVLLKYVLLSPSDKPVKTTFDTPSDAQIKLNGRVGGNQSIDPWKYVKQGYSLPTGTTNTIQFKPSDMNTNDDDGMQYEPALMFSAYAHEAGDIVVQYVDMNKLVNGKPSVIGQQDVKNDNDWLVGQTVNLGQMGAGTSNGGTQYVLNVPSGYHLAHDTNPVIAGAVPSQHATDSGARKLLSLGSFYHRPVGLFLTVGLTQPATPKKPKQPAKPASQSNTTPVQPASASSTNSQSMSASASTSSMASQSVAPNDSTSAGNTYIYNTSNVTNNYNSSEYVTNTVSAAPSSSVTTARPSSATDNRNMTKSIKSSHVKSVHSFQAVQAMKPGSTVRYHGVEIERLSAKGRNLFYFYITKPCYLHDSMKFTEHNRAHILKTGHAITLPIQRIFKINGIVRYEVRLGRHEYFVTGNRAFTHNAYYQLRDIRRNGHNYRHIKMLRGAIEYRNRYFSRWSRVRNLHKGDILAIRRVVQIARKHMTRFQLTNGHWVTSNKNFVKLFK